MSAEFWAIMGVGVTVLAVGVAILALGWNMYSTLRADVSDVKERLSALEATVGLIVQGLRIEVRGGK